MIYKINKEDFQLFGYSKNIYGIGETSIAQKIPIELRYLRDYRYRNFKGKIKRAAKKVLTSIS